MPIIKVEGKKNGKQKYIARVNFVAPDGSYKSKQVTAYGMDDAKQKEYELSQQCNPSTSAKPTVKELCEKFLQKQKYEIRESSYHKSKRNLEMHILPYLGTKRIDRLTSPVLLEWKHKIEEQRTAQDKPYSLSYKKVIYKEFHALLEFGVQMDYIPRNPLNKVGNFKSSYDMPTKKNIDFYTADEFKLFIAAALSEAERVNSIKEYGFYTFFMLAFYAGLRKGEINALTWNDIDLDNDIIHITKSVTQKLKGGDRITPPKNKSSIRDVKIPTQLKEALKGQYMRQKEASQFKEDWNVCGGAEPLRDTTIEYKNGVYAEKAEIKKIRIHDFRHSHASLLIYRRVNIKEISRRLGHSTVEQTWNTYAHLYPSEEEYAIQVLNEI